MIGKKKNFQADVQAACEGGCFNIPQLVLLFELESSSHNNRVAYKSELG